MTDKLFRATLITSLREVREAQRELDGKLENGVLATFSDIDNFVYLLRHRSAADSDVYMISRGHVSSLDCTSNRNLYHLMGIVRAAIRKDTVVLSYDNFPTAFSEADTGIVDFEGAITPIPARPQEEDEGKIYTPPFYLSLASLLNDKDFREGIKTRNSSILGDVEAKHCSILTFNPGRVKAYQMPLI